MNTILKTRLHYYRYNVGIPVEQSAWATLVDDLRKKGLKKLVVTLHPSGEFRDKVKALDGQEVGLDTKHLFDNQWNTDEQTNLRLFDWTEWDFPNRDIKSGYWLEPTHEMYGIREHTLKCGYCAYMVPDTEKQPGDFCNECLGSEYLTEKDLHLTRLLPINSEFKGSRPKLTGEELAARRPLFVDAQIHGNTERSRERLAAKRVKLWEDRESRMRAANVEYEGNIWLMDNGVNTGNVIYYKHTHMFNFGWRKALSNSEVLELGLALKDFPFPHEFKTQE